LKTVLHKAKRSILFLQRANAGEYEALLKVLKHTYGRVGKRKHELLAPLLRTDLPTKHENEGSRTGRNHVDLKGHRLEGVPAPLTSPKKNDKDDIIEFTISERYQKLVVLVKRHTGVPTQTFKSGRPTVRSLVHKVPELNLWMRPQPRKRLASMAREWYRKLLEKLMPPLPEDEWNRLEALVIGQAQWEGPRVRRSSSAVKLDRLNFRDLAKLTLKGGEVTDKHHIGSGDQWMQEPTKMEEAMIDLVNHHARLGKVDTKSPSPSALRAITPRFMRRLWLAVFMQCPKMTWDGDTNKWAVEWGYLPASSDRGRFKELTKASLSSSSETPSPLETLFSDSTVNSSRQDTNKTATDIRARHESTTPVVDRSSRSGKRQSTAPL